MNLLKTAILSAIASANLSLISSAAEVMDRAPEGFIHISEKKEKDDLGEYLIQRNHISSVVVVEKVIPSGAEIGVSDKYFEVAIDTLASNNKVTFAFKFKTIDLAMDFVRDLLEKP